VIGACVKNSKILIWAIGFFLFSNSISFSQITQISLAADYSAFKLSDDSSVTCVEIYYNIPRCQLNFQPAETGYVAYLDFKIIINDKNNNSLDSISWRAACQINRLDQLADKDYLISDLVTQYISPGDYILNLSVNNSGRVGQINFDMGVPEFSPSALALSSIQLAYDISPDSVGKFLKSGYKVMPNPSGVFAASMPHIYIYAEVYNMNHDLDDDSLYSVGFTVINSINDTVKISPQNPYKKPGRSAVIITGFSPDGLSAGKYLICLEINDGANRAVSSKEFEIYKPRIVFAASDTISAPYTANSLDGLILSDSDAARFREDIFYLANRDEMKIFDSMDLSGKENFRKSFWRKYDQDRSTPQNEFKIEYHRRLRYADQAYGKEASGLRGLKTDRGRIYILYGEPTDIEQNQSSMDTRAWERWWYSNLEGGVYFIFVDMGSATDYTLVHSTKKTEIKDENWEDKIRMTTLYER